MTMKGAVFFLWLRSFLKTARKRGWNVIDILDGSAERFMDAFDSVPPSGGIKCPALAVRGGRSAPTGVGEPGTPPAGPALYWGEKALRMERRGKVRWRRGADRESHASVRTRYIGGSCLEGTKSEVQYARSPH